MGSENLHEPRELMSEGTIDRHRAVISIMEELEAIDWYDQRAAATADAELRAVLEHNRDEEKEHAAMTLEWLRRHDPVLDAELRKYLFRDGGIVEAEEEAASTEAEAEVAASAAPAPGDGSLSVGDLRVGRGA